MSTWIPISEHLPTREDADERGEVVWKWADGVTCTGRFDEDPAVAWLPLPRYTPPKPGPTDEECKSLWNVTAPLKGGTEVPIMRDYVPDRMRRWFADVTARIEREKAR